MDNVPAPLLPRDEEEIAISAFIDSDREIFKTLLSNSAHAVAKALSVSPERGFEIMLNLLARKVLDTRFDDPPDSPAAAGYVVVHRLVRWVRV